MIIAEALFVIYEQMSENEKNAFLKMVGVDFIKDKSIKFKRKISTRYRLVPEELFERFLANVGWEEIDSPTISEVANYVGVTTHKIRKDVLKPGCPLKVIHEGKKGRGNDRRFLKLSVESYKKWLNGYTL